MEYKTRISANSDRPDFRLFSTFLWGENHNVDSEGNSYNPASRTWTALYMSSRELEDQAFEIEEIRDNPSTLEVISSNKLLALRAAFFLCKETNGKVIWDDGELYDPDFLSGKLGADFDLHEAIRRANASIWRKSTLENPYPNLQ